MSILERIMNAKRIEVAERQRKTPIEQLREMAYVASPPRGFRAALKDAADTGYGLITEIKKASPSKGLIRADFDPEALARLYASGGATCLSVLTDETWFQGADAHLEQARDATVLPTLRKDFLVDPYQVVESRALGADCILIIMAAVGPFLAAKLLSTAREWRMDALVEVHTRTELEAAIGLRADCIGINNRDLSTFETDLATTEQIAPDAPDGCLLVAESGISERADLDRLARHGVRCFLVGESLMRSADVKAATERLHAPIS